MILTACPVTSVERVGSNIYVLSFLSPEIAAAAKAGQFVNIKANDTFLPLFRRPFSIYHVERDTVRIIFQVFGGGTRALLQKHVGEKIDVLGPLGCGFILDGNFETALLVAGGLGVASLPVASQKLQHHKKVVSFLGGRSKEHLVTEYLQSVHTATDDGSSGYHGTVVSLLTEYLDQNQVVKPKIFACGPNVMLEALGKLARERSIPCEVSLETPMACGIGICQGCPVERTNGTKKYSLACKEGPVFDIQTVRFPEW